MRRLSGLLLLLASLTLGLALAAQDSVEVGKEVDSRTATEKGPEVDPAPSDEAATEAGVRIDAEELDTEAEVDAAFEALAAEAENQAAWPNTETRFLATQEDLSIFLMLLDQAGLTETLAEGDRSITIFAPNDAAFARMDAQRFAELFEDQAALRDFLERHIASDRFSEADLEAGLAGTAAVAAGGPGEQAVAARADVDAAAGGDGVLDQDAAVIPGDETVAGGASAQAADPAPDSFFRVPTRAGVDVEVGVRPAHVRAEMMQLEQETPPAGSEVAGGGAAAAAEEPAPIGAAQGSYYVGNAQIVEPDLSIEGLTLHVIDAVLLPSSPGAGAAR